MKKALLTYSLTGLAGVLIFCALLPSLASAQQAPPYEVEASYRADWLSEGDGQAGTIAASVSRYAFSNWTGFTARLAYQRRGEEVDLRRTVTGGLYSPGAERLRTFVTDLTFSIGISAAGSCRLAR